MKKIIHFILALFIAFSANTQNINCIKIGHAFNKKIKGKEINRENSFELIKEFINDDISFKKFKETTTQLRNEKGQLSHEQFQQYYKGIKVENGIYFVHSKNNKIISVNGNIVPLKELNTSPSITPKEALEFSLNYLNTNVCSREHRESDVIFEDAKFMPEGELLYINDSINKLTLSYKFKIKTLNPYDSWIIYINALSGDPVKVKSLFKASNEETVITTRYSGTKSIFTTYSPQYDYYLSNNHYGINSVYNAHYEEVIDFEIHSYNFISDNDNNWTALEWNNLAKDNIAFDVSWASWKIKDFLHDVIGIDSYDNSNGKLTSYIHYMVNLQNAGSWIDDSVMAFGDGNGIDTNPFGSLDIVAHEVGHKINYSALNSNEFDDGALEEGFADIFSICAENYIAPEKEAWTIGEEVCITRPFIRSFSNPKSLSFQNKRYADTYGGDYWNLGDYHRSTVLSHWFYILNEGEEGTNDLGNYYDVTGIDEINESVQSVYEMIDGGYILYDSDFQDIKEQSIEYIQATCGEVSNESINAMQAWYAVGVPGDCIVNIDNLTINNSSSYVNLDVGDCEIVFSNVSYSTGTNAHYKAGSVTISDSFEVPAGATFEVEQ